MNKVLFLIKPFESLNVKELSVMLAALDWTAEAFSEATGISLPVIEKTTVSKLSRFQPY